MNTQATLQELSELKLKGMESTYEAILALPVNQHPEAHELVAQLTQSERLNRKHRKTETLLRLSKLRYASAIEEISCTPDRNLKPEQISGLADCNYIQRAENVLITGATGCGKSYIACALGHQACLMGHKTWYLNMTLFVEKITLARLEGTFIKLLTQIEKVQLLILDDFGLQPLNAETRLALLQILEDRYKRKSTIIASQLPVLKWFEYIGDDTLADAILDRLSTRAHRIELKGKSLREQIKK